RPARLPLPDPGRRRRGRNRGHGEGGGRELRLPKFEVAPATVAIRLDGTCMLMGEDGRRETMVGTLSFYDKEGERQHTIHLAAAPEYGKAKFLGRMGGGS